MYNIIYDLQKQSAPDNDNVDLQLKREEFLLLRKENSKADDIPIVKNMPSKFSLLQDNYFYFTKNENLAKKQFIPKISPTFL